ncbi:MAG: Na/Pi cotransporter family protein [Saprospirales bacterium]|nr:MAG: Na/Pi cotransporter family protein [Saprospirales bacterium]
MIQEEFNIWLLVAGLGVFLYSMHLLEISVKELGGDLLRNFIKKYTEGVLKSIFTGATVTALIQSSSAVSLMVLAFAGAGMITLSGAIGVIIGSNLGTTITSWVIAGLGFKFSIEAVSLPFIGLGGMGIAFIRRKTTLKKVCALAFAFGLLLLGLGFMKEATDVLAGQIDISAIADSRLLFLFGGVMLAALMQSSSAAVLIAFSGLYSGIFGWDAASHLVIGTALGTTITVFLGSISGGTLQKRIAASHFFFNVVTVLIALILAPLYNLLILDVLGYRDDMIIGLALFHTFFKLVGVILFAAILFPYTNFIKWIISESKPVQTRYISKITSEVPEAGVEALKNEAAMFQNMCLYFILKTFGLSVTQGVLPGFTYRHRLEEFKKMDAPNRYEYLKDLQAEIYSFAASIRAQEIKESNDKEIRDKLAAVRSYMMAVKKAKDLSPDIAKLRSSGIDVMRDLYLDMQRLVSFIARDIGNIDELDLEDKAALSKILAMDQYADKQVNETMDRLNKMISAGSIPYREQSSLIAVYNEFHQIFIFFLEGLKHIKELDEEQIAMAG